MLDELIGGYKQGHGGYGFEEHREFVSHEESERGYFDRQARYDHQMRLPANHGRPPMSHMPVCDEEDSDSDVEYFESSRRSHHTTVLPHYSNNHSGKMGNGWQGPYEDAYHGGHGMQHQGGHGMQPQGGQEMQYQGRHEMQHQRDPGMKHQGKHEMQYQGRHEIQHQRDPGMKHQDRLMVPQAPPHHVYMNPIQGSGGGRAVVMKAFENRRVSNSSGGHQKVGWGSKGL